jgi:hypothetical protein
MKSQKWTDSTNSPARIRTEVTASRGLYDWPLHHGAAVLLVERRIF